METFCFTTNDDHKLHGVFLPAKRDPPQHPLIMLHGGGPDHKSLLPLAESLCINRNIILPDVRGYGKSVCYDKTCYTWNRYAEDVAELLHHFNIKEAVIGGTGIGSTISLKTSILYPKIVKGLVLISVEDIEDDVAKEAEILFFEKYMKQLQEDGLSAAWESILPQMSAIIGEMVRDGIKRSDAQSILAAGSIVYDRAFKNVDELAVINVPTLLIPGGDVRHPSELANQISRKISNATLSTVGISDDIRTIHEFAQVFYPIIYNFLKTNNL
ncbi:alpha/beta fold hydrolase [Algoriphagus boritolerans]|uniref:Pimeloyl-ACP methyl ester carboxylesterase n=2 Tax=Algoriphagus TaxID=246875 RepID=A0A1H6AQL6_9BACT|nr:alpha/beta hydrolase [Algoriphagus boritolerans]SEG50682.1 Pimeloyl-ACP methyl ester carboxylesterase [Algoriphagus boritolerans DSM 17298 = JCM 18970]